MATTPITELNNELSTNLEAEDALGFVRTLRAVDAQIWSGYKAHPGLLDAAVPRVVHPLWYTPLVCHWCLQPLRSAWCCEVCGAVD